MVLQDGWTFVCLAKISYIHSIKNLYAYDELIKPSPDQTLYSFIHIVFRKLTL